MEIPYRWYFLFNSSYVIAMMFKLHWALLCDPAQGFPKRRRRKLVEIHSFWSCWTHLGLRWDAVPWAAAPCSYGSLCPPSIMHTYPFWQGQLRHCWHFLSLHCCLPSTILSSSLKTSMENVLKRKMYTKVWQQQIAKYSLVADYSLKV